MFFAGPSEAGANERLSPAPVLWKDGQINDNFLFDTAVWFNDHFFLRQELISANNLLNTSLLQTSEKDSVILGTDGWLYYGSTLDDYTGRNPMSDRELSAASRNLELMAQYCAENNKRFTFMICPNKNSLYSGNMPDFGAVNLEHDGVKLLSLTENVTYVDLFEAFSQQDEILYFRTDSHWNSKGAALGADLINGSFGKTTDYFSGSFAQTNDYTGDLYEMLYPAFSGNESQPIYQGQLDFTFTGKQTRPDSITLLTQSSGSDSLLAYRDSFGNLLFPYLADSYGSARFSRSTSYDLTLDADYILIELVERNLRYLITYVPVMPSPVCQISSAPPEGTTPVQRSTTKQVPQGTHLWTGNLDYNPGDRIYIESAGTHYEAFQTQDGFAVYLPEGQMPETVTIQNAQSTLTLFAQ
jgi:hypothetical protein